MNRILFLLFSTALAAHAQSRFSPQALASVNSVYDEQNPIVSPDGNTLYFTVAGHPQNLEGKKAVGDIWYARWEGTRWSVPIHAGFAINSQDYNAVASFSLEGNALYLLGHYVNKGETATTQGISLSRKANEGWSAPKNINIPYFLNKSLLMAGHVNQDENVLVYSAEGYETKGVEDVYVSIKDNQGNWSEPKNVGPAINTPFQELCPSLSADQRTLYFSSNKPGGFGSFDVYAAQRLDDSWTNWSTPKNLGSAINTEGRELYFRTFDNDRVKLYTSTYNSDGYGDIRLFEEGEKKTNTHARLPIVKNNALLQLSGAIIDAKNGMPIQAFIELKSDSIYSIKSTESGIYELMVKPFKTYTVKIEAPGYLPLLEKMDFANMASHEMEINFKLRPIEVGVSVNLKSVLFKVSETKLLPDSFDELNTVVDLMKANPRVEIELAGHTDSRGDAKLNQRLSQGRVDKVKEYLVSKGISASRIQGKGYGGKKPIAFGDSEESRRLNRRVEFIIVKD